MPKYKKIAEISNVRFEIPKQGTYMNFVKEETVDGEIIKGHWKNGLLMQVRGGKTILNRNFFNISENQLGKTVVGKIELLKKTLDDGRIYFLLDFYPTKNDPAKATLEIKYIQFNFPFPEKEKLRGFFPIAGEKTGIALIKLEEKN